MKHMTNHIQQHRICTNEKSAWRALFASRPLESVSRILLGLFLSVWLPLNRLILRYQICVSAFLLCALQLCSIGVTRILSLGHQGLVCEYRQSNTLGDIRKVVQSVFDRNMEIMTKGQNMATEINDKGKENYRELRQRIHERKYERVKIAEENRNQSFLQAWRAQ
jgi:hypothetical protein